MIKSALSIAIMAHLTGLPVLASHEDPRLIDQVQDSDLIDNPDIWFDHTFLPEIESQLEELLALPYQDYVSYSRHSLVLQAFATKMRVFVLKAFPKIVFKIDRRGKRYENAAKVRALVKQMRLDRLFVPDSEQLIIHLEDGSKRQIIAEQKFDLAYTAKMNDAPDAFHIANEARWNEAFAKMQDDAATYERLKDIYVQLAKIICATGFWDISWVNIPLLAEEQGVVLVDLNDVLDYTVTREGFNFADRQLEGIRTLLEHAHPDFYRVIIDTAMNELGKTQAEVLMKWGVTNIGGEYRLGRSPYEIQDIASHFRLL